MQVRRGGNARAYDRDGSRKVADAPWGVVTNNTGPVTFRVFQVGSSDPSVLFEVVHSRGVPSGVTEGAASATTTGTQRTWRHPEPWEEIASGVAAKMGEDTVEMFKKQLEEARKTYKLNVGYSGLTSLPADFVESVKKWNPHIIELELSSNKLTDLPKALSELMYIRVLRVKYNNLERFPAVIFQLSQLMVLDLSGNKLMEVPAAIGGLQHLKEMDVSGNAIRTVSESIGQLSNLQLLQIENNQLAELPEEISGLSSLVKLDVSTNQLRKLPESFGLLRKIQRVDATNNLLELVPPSIGNLKTLKELNLRYNNLEDSYKKKSEEGLSKFLAFLKEEEERMRLEETERLKPIGTQVGSYLEYRCKAEILDDAQLPGGRVGHRDNRCWIRSGHTITQADTLLLLFGGKIIKDGVKTNQLFRMSTDRMEWHLQPCSGDNPCARDGHVAVYDSERHRLVVFGGRNAERKRLNEVHYLDLETWTWHQPPCTGDGPSPREMSSGVYWQGFMVLFGGHAKGARTSDVYKLDLETWKWDIPAIAGTVPSPRQSAALAVAQGHYLLLHGGTNNFVQQDLWALDMGTSLWTEVQLQGRQPSARHCHIMGSDGGETVYIFGGYDDLGAQSDALWRIKVDYGVNLSAAKLEWVELDSELPFNRSRTYSFHKGMLSTYQLGSNALGRVSDEEAEKGTVFWDVFKCCQLSSLKERVLSQELLRPKNPKRLRLQHTTTIASKMPPGFTHQSTSELKVLAYVEDWQHIFAELYRHRRPLPLCPLNECGLPKFAPTTLRPTQLPYPELYTLEGAVSFVADFIAYEPLEFPMHPPSHVASPMSVLQWQAGDCFDIAVVLCSLLLGVGYDAYVVMGYAPIAVTTHDLRKGDCPEAAQRSGSGAAEADAAADGKAAADAVQAPKYTIKQPLVLESRFIKDQEAKQKEKAGQQAAVEAGQEAAAESDNAAGEGPEPAAEEAGGESLENERNAGAGSRLVHAWVLVRAGKRGVEEHLFVEPSTGRQYRTSEAPYMGVECCWNSDNFWACMQMPEPHSDSRAMCKSLVFDMNEPALWEPVMPPRQLMPQLQSPASGRKAEEEEEEESLKSPAARLQVSPSRAPSRASMPSGKLAQSSRSKTASSDRPTSASSRAQADGGGASAAPGDPSADLEPVPDVPVSWVPKLSVPRDLLDMRCPRGVKIREYRRCRQEIFAFFGECSRHDGMLERITLFDDDACTVVREVRQKFVMRRDKLRYRLFLVQEGIKQELFDPGSTYGLREITITGNEQRRFVFYPKARLDGLMERNELLGGKTTETFTERDDRMIYRSVTYQSVAEPSASAEGAAPGRKRAPRRKGDSHQLPIRKMTVKFARNEDVHADKDVARRIFCCQEDWIRQDYHYAPDRITCSSRTFYKDGSSKLVQADMLSDVPSASELMEQFQSLIHLEKDCMQSVRDNEWESKDILQMRQTQENTLPLTATPYYDVVRIKADESDDEPEDKKEVQYDYLSPFLPVSKGAKAAHVLSRSEALAVREACLKALKDRLIERANIIQARLDDESAQLAKRQANFQRDRDQMTQADELEHERACEESMFRIHILEKRLQRHEEQALQKYYELDVKLRKDSRLRVLSDPNAA